MNAFQTLILLIFSVLAVIGVAFFALTQSNSGQLFLGQVVMWGTLPSAQMNAVIEDVNTKNSEEFSVSYQEVMPEDFERKFVEGIAAGRGPDVVIFPDQFFYRQADKLAPFPLEALSERSFRDTFAERGEVFLRKNGAYALPVSIDPLVMYWNRDLVSSAGLSRVPRTWEEVVGNAASLTKKDDRGNVTQSAVTLGGIRNMSNMKAIVSALLLQVGDPIVAVGADGVEKSLLGSTRPSGEPSLSTLRFYTDFSNPLKSIYTWNTALPEARSLFTRGALVLYFGFASELATIRAEKPNLNFDVALLPHKESDTPITFGRVYGLAMVKSAKNQIGAQKAAYAMMDGALQKKISQTVGMPSANRSILAEDEVDAVKEVFKKAALISRGWLDPDSSASNQIFANMVDRVMTGTLTTERAVGEAQRELGNLLR